VYLLAPSFTDVMATYSMFASTSHGHDAAEDRALLDRYYGDHADLDDDVDMRSRATRRNHDRRRNDDDDDEEAAEEEELRSLPDEKKVYGHPSPHRRATPPRGRVVGFESVAPGSIAKICWYWRWGGCKYAEGCRYHHPPSEFNTVSRPAAAPSVPVAAVFASARPSSVAVFALHAASMRDAQRIQTLESEVGSLRHTVVAQNQLLAFAQSSITAAVTPSSSPAGGKSKKQRRREAAAQRVAQHQQRQEASSHAAAASSKAFERPTAAAAAIPVQARVRRKRGYGEVDHPSQAPFTAATAPPSPVSHLVHAKQERAVRAARARVNKDSLDQEMDSLKRENSLATIMEG
jgi:hypothetical protein